MLRTSLVGLGLACILCGANSIWKPDFRNIAKEAGLAAVFPNGGDTAKQFIVETTGSGVAIFDYDNDGLPDLFVVSGDGGTNRLYHNEGHDRFRDVT
ncbi:MAG: FG-GAP repeat domain-containing protein, partial [Bryobacteraceae bacterium]